MGIKLRWLKDLDSKRIDLTRVRGKVIKDQAETEVRIKFRIKHMELL